MRKVLAVILVVAVLSCVVAFLFQLKTSSSTSSVNLTRNVPNNAVFMVECNSLKAFIEGTKDNMSLVQGLQLNQKSFPLGWINALQAQNQNLVDVPATMSLHQTGQGIFNALVQLYLKPNVDFTNFLGEDSIGNTPTSKYEKVAIHELRFADIKLYVTHNNQSVFISEHLETIKSCIRWQNSLGTTDQMSNDWLSLRSTRGTEELGHLYVNPALWNDWSTTITDFPKVWLPKTFQANVCLDIQPGLTNYRFTGIADVLPNNTAIFTQESNSVAPKYLMDVPVGIRHILWWNITRWDAYVDAVSQYHNSHQRGTSFENSLKELMESSRMVFEQKLQDLFENEVFQWHFLDGTIQAMHVSSTNKFLRYFGSVLGDPEMSGGLSFYSVPTALRYIITPTLAYTKKPIYLCFAGNFVFIGKSKILLQKCVRAWQTKDLVNLQEQFPELGKEINLNANHIQIAVGNNSTDTTLWPNYFQSQQKLGISTFSHLKNNRFYQEYLGVFKEGLDHKLTQLLWSWKSASPLIYVPTATTNHYTGNQELVCIDSLSNLSLHSKSGRVLWSKSLTHKILRAPIQIDIYNNGKLQLAANTERTLELIDRNGNNVAPFPVHLKYQATSPMLVADYNLTKDYRFLFGASNKLFNYGTDGEPTKGWSVFEADTTISTKPWYLKIGKKDYLVTIDDQGRAYVLNRRGKIRYPCMVAITDAASEIYLEKGTDISNCKFRYINTNDYLVSYYFNGKKDEQKLQSIDQISQCSKVDFQNQKMWVVLSDQTLFILDENLRTQSQINDVRFPFHTTGNTQYPLAYNSASSDSLYVVDHDHKRHSTIEKKIANAQMVSFSKSAKPSLVVTKKDEVFCYPFSN